MIKQTNHLINYLFFSQSTGVTQASGTAINIPAKII